MISTPAGWRVSHIEDAFIFTAPGGADDGRLVYVERQRPLRSTTALIGELGAPAGFTATHRTAPARFVTAEGEHGAFVTVRGTLDERRAGLVYGFVFLDDFYASLTGVAYGDEVAGVEVLARRLISEDAHVLGRVRRRRFGYALPAGWLATGGLFGARLYPPDHPRNPAQIHVSPALPRLPGLIERTLTGMAAGRTIAAPAPLPNARLTANLFQVAGEGPHFDAFVFLEDEHFVYPIRMTARTGTDDLAVLVRLVETVEPIPGAAPVGAGAALAHWAE